MVLAGPIVHNMVSSFSTHYVEGMITASAYSLSLGGIHVIGTNTHIEREREREREVHRTVFRAFLRLVCSPCRRSPHSEGDGWDFRVPLDTLS